eukprot:3298184-Pyramimonas_sp.AAC.1
MGYEGGAAVPGSKSSPALTGRISPENSPAAPDSSPAAPYNSPAAPYSSPLGLSALALTEGEVALQHVVVRMRRIQLPPH